jgi:hypothetical protein
MPTPLSYSFVGLATGITICMNNCPVPFNFAFVQGGRNRFDALMRGMYDFVILSKSAAIHFATAEPTVEIAMILEDGIYAEPFVFCSRSPDITTIRDGMSIAADPKATDQFKITQQLCIGKNVKLLTHSFATCKALFLAGEVDCVLYHRDEWTHSEGVWTHEVFATSDKDYNTPALLVLRSNLAISKILRAYLVNKEIARIQKQVVSREIEPQL